MLVSLIKILLIYWILTVIIRWYQRARTNRSRSYQAPPKPDKPLEPNAPPDVPVNGNIEDAEFEELSKTK